MKTPWKMKYTWNCLYCWKKEKNQNQNNQGDTQTFRENFLLFIGLCNWFFSFFFFFLSWYPSFRFSSFLLKGALESLRPFLMTESPLKMMKNAFYFTLKALFVFKIFKFLLWLFGHVQKTARLERYVNFKIHDVTTWLTNNFNTHIVQYLKKERQPGNETWSVSRI